MQGGRAGTVSTAQGRLVVLGRSGLNGCGIPSPCDGEAPVPPWQAHRPLGSTTASRGRICWDLGAGNAMVKNLQPPPPAWAGLDDPAPPRQGRGPSVTLLQQPRSWRSAGSHSQCPPALGTRLQATPASHQPRPTIQAGTASLQLPLTFLARKEHPQAGRA